VGSLCASRPSSRFTTSVRGYLESAALNGIGGGRVGRLFSAPVPHAFSVSNRKPFVEVWGTIHWSFALDDHPVSVHGLLACDAATVRSNHLSGWRGSIRPDRLTAG
jgi:hypothetical protein